MFSRDLAGQRIGREQERSRSRSNEAPSSTAAPRPRLPDSGGGAAAVPGPPSSPRGVTQAYPNSVGAMARTPTYVGPLSCRAGDGSLALNFKRLGRRTKSGESLHEKHQVRPRAGDRRRLHGPSERGRRVGQTSVQHPFRALHVHRNRRERSGRVAERPGAFDRPFSPTARTSSRSVSAVRASGSRTRVSSGTFGDQTFFADLGDEAGETGASRHHGQGGGVRQNEVRCALHVLRVRLRHRSGGRRDRERRAQTTARGTECRTCASSTAPTARPRRPRVQPDRQRGEHRVDVRSGHRGGEPVSRDRGIPCGSRSSTSTARTPTW